MHTYIDTLLRSNTHKCVAINAATHTYTHTIDFDRVTFKVSVWRSFGVFSVNEEKKNQCFAASSNKATPK